MTRRLLKLASWLGLAGALGAPLAFLTGAVDLATMQVVLLVSTVLWFGSAPWWVGRRGEG